MSIVSTFNSTRIAWLLATTLSTSLAVEPLIPAASETVPVADTAPVLDDLPLLDPSADSSPSAELIGPGAPPANASTNAMVNLVNLLVAKGNLTRQEGNALLSQAEQDAANARAQIAAVAAEPVSDGDVRVNYIPEVVRARMRDEIKDEVLAAARNEKWASAGLVPEWTTRYKPFGDVRLRYESVNYPVGNDNTGAFPNFNSINTGSAFDVSGTVFSPQLNVDADRQRVRLRARMGLDVNLEEGWIAGVRLATGENNSPTSVNQSLGAANNGQGGNFSKYAIWLDRAFFRYEFGSDARRNVALSFGRFDNPFFCSDILFDEDVGIDGIAVTGKYRLGENFTPFLTASAAPVFNTDLNFSSNQPSKFKSTDKWMFAGQVGFDWEITKKIDLKVGAGYYFFKDVEGELSDPYTPLTAQDAGSTDGRRPSFAQRGNTYMPLRNIIPSALNNFGTTNQFQYFGLATPFEVLSLTGKLDFNHWEPFQISIKGEYLKNLAWNQLDINSVAVNNRGPNPEPADPATTAAEAESVTDDGTGTATTAASEPTPIGDYEGGDTAWILQMQIGKPVFEKRGDWSAFAGYRYVESDAVIDGFTDSRFALGGTNAKGFLIGGSLALSKRTKFSLMYMSAEQIAGPPLKSNVFTVDFSAKF
jgi:hypothetical protein